MTKPTKPDDPAQSERFKEIVRELEADGDLNLTEAEAAFERAMDKVAPSKLKPGQARNRLPNAPRDT